MVSTAVGEDSGGENNSAAPGDIDAAMQATIRRGCGREPLVLIRRRILIAIR